MRVLVTGAGGGHRPRRALVAPAEPGNHVVNVVAPDTTAVVPTRDLLGFTPAHQWRTAE